MWEAVDKNRTGMGVYGGRRAMISLVLSLLFLVACGGHENAVLEVRLQLPVQVDATGATRRFARVAVLPVGTVLERTTRLTVPSQGFELDRNDERGCNVTLSVVANDPRGDRAELERNTGHGLLLALWFCPTRSPCDSREAPLWLIDFDKAMWPGERTFFEASAERGRCSRWGIPVSTLPSTQRGDAVEGGFDAELRVRECQVLGCLDESSQPAEEGFCTTGGVHPCE